MKRISNNYWIGKALLLILFALMSTVCGIIIFYEDFSIFRLVIYSIIISSFILLLRPHYLLKSQEVYLDKDDIYLPKTNERITFSGILKIKRYFGGFHYKLYLDNNQKIYFINLDIPDSPLGFVFMEDCEDIKELKKRITSHNTI